MHRRAGAKDVPAIRDLVRTAYAKWMPLIGREPVPMAADYKAALKYHRFDLLEQDGRLIALIETIDKADHVLIENVAVHPHHQGKGLGRRLIDQAESLAAQKGYNYVRLYTNQKFTDNLDLYARLGYAIDREESFQGGICVHMIKRLA